MIDDRILVEKTKSPDLTSLSSFVTLLANFPFQAGVVSHQWCANPLRVPSRIEGMIHSARRDWM
jgi:hypothetical protein